MSSRFELASELSLRFVRPHPQWVMTMAVAMAYALKVGILYSLSAC